MTNRDWFSLALRLFGIWLLIQSIEAILPYLILAVSGGMFGQNIISMATMIIWLVGRMAVGLLLVIYAPAFGMRLYPSEASPQAEKSVNETRALRVGIQLLAVYALLLAVQAGAGVVFGLFTEDVGNLSWGSDFYFGGERGYLSNLLTFGFNLAFAAALLIWNEGIVTFITKFRYVAERDAYEPPPLEE